MGEPSLVFTGLWFDSIRLPSEKYKIISWKKKEFEDLQDLVISFRLYFVIAGTSYVSLPCTIYSYKYIWCWLSKKKDWSRLQWCSVVLTKQNLAQLTSFLLLSLEADIHAKNTAIAKLLNPVATQLLAFICAPWRLHDALCSHYDYRSTQR
jgi:hypothetical protein